MGPEETRVWQWKGNIRTRTVMEVFCSSLMVSASWFPCYTLILQDGTTRRKSVMDTWVPSVPFLRTAWESQNKFNYEKNNTACVARDRWNNSSSRNVHGYRIHYDHLFLFTCVQISTTQDLLKFTQVNLEFLCRVIVSSGFPVLSSVVQNPVSLGHPTYSC